MRASKIPRVVAAWSSACPRSLALLVEADPHPNVIIGGPTAIKKQIRKRLSAKLVAAICACLSELWADPRREETMLALVVTSDAQLVAMGVDRAAFGVPEPPIKPVSLAARVRRPMSASGGYVSMAISRRTALAAPTCGRVQPATRSRIVAVAADGELSYGYAPRSEVRGGLPRAGPA